VETVEVEKNVLILNALIIHYVRKMDLNADLALKPEIAENVQQVCFVPMENVVTDVKLEQ